MADELQASQPPAPQTPQPAASNQPDAATPEDSEDMQKCKAPSTQQMSDLAELTREAISEGLIDELSDQAKEGQICGSLLELEEVAAPRRQAIDWLSHQFDSFGFRDEWLAEAILLMDRAAVLEQSSEAARKAMESQNFWLGAVQIALKMSEAEAELDSSITDLVVPLVPFGPDGDQCTRKRWSVIQRAEMCLSRALDFRFVVPSALLLVQHMAVEMCAAVCNDTRAAPGSPREVAAERWPGLMVGHLPYVVGPPLRTAKMEEERLAMVLPRRPLRRVQALACFLTELAVVHMPGVVYGDKLPAESLAVTALQLALHSFGSKPPEACKAFLADVKARLLPPDRLPEVVLENLLVSVYHLWSKLPEDSPVVKKWHKRQAEFTLPSAPAQAELPSFLQRKCIFSTPQRRQADERDNATTPCKPGHSAAPNSPGQVCNIQESDLEEAKSGKGMKCVLLPDASGKGSPMQAPASPMAAPAEVTSPLASPKSAATSPQSTVIDESSSPSQSSATPGSGKSAPVSEGAPQMSKAMKPFNDVHHQQITARAKESELQKFERLAMLKRKILGQDQEEPAQAPAETLHLECSKEDASKRRRVVIQQHSPPPASSSVPSGAGGALQGIATAGDSVSEPLPSVMELDTGSCLPVPEPMPGDVEVDAGASGVAPPKINLVLRLQSRKQVRSQARPLAATADLSRQSLQESAVPGWQEPAQHKAGDLSSKLRSQTGTKTLRRNPERASKSRSSSHLYVKAMRQGPDGAAAKLKEAQRMPGRSSLRLHLKRTWVPMQPFAVGRPPSTGQAGHESVRSEQQWQERTPQMQRQQAEAPHKSRDLDRLAETIAQKWHPEARSE
eukprot:TRINITY_DN25426_c0_g1_i1.p1 TRINITY_DN25426_c0_g1~~TRINITY_DN25426_c0_g1_i1.p1  ORF type:complete len:867 (+),score=191.72 TRINITY_DN25426_c0_g1_i1:64-2601(+)